MAGSCNQKALAEYDDSDSIDTNSAARGYTKFQEWCQGRYNGTESYDLMNDELAARTLTRMLRAEIERRGI